VLHLVSDADTKQKNKKVTEDFMMENYSISALLVVFLMTLFIELNIINFEVLRIRSVEENGVEIVLYVMLRAEIFLLFVFPPTLKILLNAPQSLLLQ
jgi:hypothetical protein